jgi:putative endonuclease
MAPSSVIEVDARSAALEITVAVDEVLADRDSGSSTRAMPHVYVLRCSDGSYYVGSTVNLEARLRQHELGEAAEYTKRRRPVSLVYAHEFATAAEAFAMEKKIQGWSRAKREALIAGRFDLLPDLSSRTPTKRSMPKPR